MNYGDYQAGDQLNRGENSVLYKAKKVGQGDDTSALKVSWIGQDADSANLLASVRRQESAASAGAKGIAPIYASGQNSASVYCVTKRYARSLLFFVKGKVVVSTEGLEHLSRSVLGALKEMQALKLGAHGNLKLSNVLMEKAGNLRSAKFALSDPAPRADAPVSSDLHSLGMIILQLVQRREITAVDWPVDRSAEWNALGPGGEAWRSFCNALLDPALAKMPDPLATIQKKLASLNQRRALSTFGSAVIWTCVLACLGGGAYVARSYFLKRAIHTTATAVPDQEQNFGWCGRLAIELNQSPSWSSGDTYANNQILGPVRDLKLNSFQAQALIQFASGIAPKAELNTASVLAACKQVNSALASWKSKQAVQKAYDTFVQRGWSVPASSLSRLRGASFSDDTPILDQIAAVYRMAALLPAVESKLDEFQTEANRLAKSDDPVLHKIRPLADAQAGAAADVSSLPGHLQAWIDRLKNAGRLAASADRTRMQREGRFRVAFEAPVDLNIFSAWEADVNRFQPLAADETAKLADRWNKRFDAVETKLKAGGASAGAALDGLAKLRADAPPIFKGLLKGDVPKLDETLGARLARFEDRPGEDGKAAAAAKDTAAFNALLAQLKANDLTKLNAAAAKQLRDQFLVNVKARTSPAFQARITQYAAALASIPFAEAPTLAPPSLTDWEGPMKTETGAAYRWNGYTLTFVEVAGEDGAPGFYAAATEIPAGLVIDWVGGHGGNWASLGIRTDVNPAGPCAWMPKPGGGITLRKEGFEWSTSMVPHLPFYQGARPNPPDALTPMNYLTAGSAASVARALGFRLPTVAEWKRTYKLAQTHDWLGSSNRRDAQWESQRAYVASCVKKIKAEGGDLRDPPWPDTGIFLPSRVSIPQGEKAAPQSSADDGALWFMPVNAGLQQKPLANLVGNVAEYVIDSVQANPKYSVIGASALSPAEVDPATSYELSAVQKLRGYSDVGLRFVLDAAAAAQANPDVAAFRKLLDTAPSGE